MDQKKTMKFANECGAVNFDNACAIEGISEQLRYFGECKWNMPEYYPPLNIATGCAIEACSEKATTLLASIHQKCEASVSLLEAGDCDKARRFNECLHRFDAVPQYFQQSCVVDVVF